MTSLKLLHVRSESGREVMLMLVFISENIDADEGHLEKLNKLLILFCWKNIKKQKSIASEFMFWLTRKRSIDFITAPNNC